jgi:hypothetical protein
VLCLGVCHSTQRRTHLNGQPLSVEAFGVEAGVSECLSGGGDAELPEPIQSPGRGTLHEFRRIEVSHLRRDAGPEG